MMYDISKNENGIYEYKMRVYIPNPQLYKNLIKQLHPNAFNIFKGLVNEYLQNDNTLLLPKTIETQTNWDIIQDQLVLFKIIDETKDSIMINPDIIQHREYKKIKRRV